MFRPRAWGKPWLQDSKPKRVMNPRFYRIFQMSVGLLSGKGILSSIFIPVITGHMFFTESSLTTLWILKSKTEYELSSLNLLINSTVYSSFLKKWFRLKLSIITYITVSGRLEAGYFARILSARDLCFWISLGRREASSNLEPEGQLAMAYSSWPLRGIGRPDWPFCRFQSE